MTPINIIDNWTMPAGAMAAQIVEERAEQARQLQMAVAIEANELELFDAVVDGKPFTAFRIQTTAESIIRDYLDEDDWSRVIRMVCLAGAKQITESQAIEDLQNLVNSAISSAAKSLAETDLGC